MMQNTVRENAANVTQHAVNAAITGKVAENLVHL